MRNEVNGRFEQVPLDILKKILEGEFTKQGTIEKTSGTKAGKVQKRISAAGMVRTSGGKS
jgi:hypothetical protein